eukprot:UN23640
MFYPKHIPFLSDMMCVYKISYHPFKKFTHSFPQSFLFLSETKLFSNSCFQISFIFLHEHKTQILFSFQRKISPKHSCNQNRLCTSTPKYIRST